MSKYTYSVLLFELGLIPPEDMIKMKKVAFFNKLFYTKVKARGNCLKLLRAEHQEPPDKGLFTEVKAFTEECYFLWS